MCFIASVKDTTALSRRKTRIECFKTLVASLDEQEEVRLDSLIYSSNRWRPSRVVRAKTLNGHVMSRDRVTGKLARENKLCKRMDTGIYVYLGKRRKHSWAGNRRPKVDVTVEVDPKDLIGTMKETGVACFNEVRITKKAYDEAVKEIKWKLQRRLKAEKRRKARRLAA